MDSSVGQPLQRPQGNTFDAFASVKRSSCVHACFGIRQSTAGLFQYLLFALLWQVAQLMNTKIGQYLSSHPFLALTALVFSAMAAPPVGLFLVFTLLTIAVTVIGFIFFEGRFVS